MAKSAKPWLNYKSDEDINVSYSAQQKRTLRSYKRALFYLICTGFAGGHKFYLYDEKKAWKIFGSYVVLIIAASFLKPFLEVAPLIVLICYAGFIIYSSYPTLKQDVECINQEIKND